MIGKNNLTFRYKKLYRGEEDTGFSVVPDKIKGMWRIRWPDGVESADFYNLTMAKENTRRIYLEGQNKAPSSPAGEFLGGESYSPTSQGVKRTSELPRAFKQQLKEFEERCWTLPEYAGYRNKK